MNENKDNFKLLALIEKPEYQNKCIELLNEEWPKSWTQREISLKKSLNSTPPMSMVFLEKRCYDEYFLIGHVRICLLPNDSRSCWVESIIISRERRKQGLGKLLMHFLDIELRKRNFKKICLSTEDKIEFYRKCGYEVCPPILNCGANSKLFEKFPINKFFLTQNCDAKPKEFENRNDALRTSISKSAPPPPPLMSSKIIESQHESLKKTYMYKDL